MSEHEHPGGVTRPCGSIALRALANSTIWWLVPAAVLLVYWHVLSASLVYDDWVNFDRNQALRDGDWFALLTQPYYRPDTTYWRPITSLSMAFAYRAGPFGVHALAIVAHTLAALVVGAIGRRLLGDPRLALLAALFFALHPLQVESVAWASALPGLLSGLFLLLTIRAVLEWSYGTASLPWSAAIWLPCAMLAKESGIVALPLIAIVVFGVKGSRPRAAKWAVCIAAALMAVAWYALHVGLAGYRRVLGDDWAWVAAVAQMTVRQISLLVLPWPLTPFRVPPDGTGSDAIDATFVVAAVAGVALTVVLWRRLADPGRVAVALVAMPLLLNAITFLAVGPHPLTDRYLYVAVSGFSLVVVSGLRRQRFVLSALVVVGGIVAAGQVPVWQDDRAFTLHVLDISPGDASVHVLAGKIALQVGDRAGLIEARREYQSALALWPQRMDKFARRQRAAAIAGLAWCDTMDSEYDVAHRRKGLIERFHRALVEDSEYVPAWVGLGVVCALDRRSDEALAAFATALQLDPLCPEAWFNRGRLQLELGRSAEARDSLGRALQCDPGLRAAAKLLADLR